MSEQPATPSPPSGLRAFAIRWETFVRPIYYTTAVIALAFAGLMAAVGALGWAGIGMATYVAAMLIPITVNIWIITRSLRTEEGPSRTAFGALVNSSIGSTLSVAILMLASVFFTAGAGDARDREVINAILSHLRSTASREWNPPTPFVTEGARAFQPLQAITGVGAILCACMATYASLTLVIHGPVLIRAAAGLPPKPDKTTSQA